MWSSPLAVYVITTVAVALALVEVALPTFGVAGLSAGAMGALALWGVDSRSHPGWPFVLIGFAFTLWAVELVRGSASLRWIAAAAFGLGSISFGAATSDLGTTLCGAAATVGFAAGFPALAGAMTRLNSAASTVGLEAFSGRRAVVDRWDQGTGTVMIDGSRWNAVGPPFLDPGATVVVVGHDRMTLTVAFTEALPEQENPS